MRAISVDPGPGLERLAPGPLRVARRGRGGGGGGRGRCSCRGRTRSTGRPGWLGPFHALNNPVRRPRRCVDRRGFSAGPLEPLCRRCSTPCMASCFAVPPRSTARRPRCFSPAAFASRAYRRHWPPARAGQQRPRFVEARPASSAHRPTLSWPTTTPWAAGDPFTRRGVQARPAVEPDGTADAPAGTWWPVSLESAGASAVASADPAREPDRRRGDGAPHRTAAVWSGSTARPAEPAPRARGGRPPGCRTTCARRHHKKVNVSSSGAYVFFGKMNVICPEGLKVSLTDLKAGLVRFLILAATIRSSEVVISAMASRNGIRRRLQPERARGSWCTHRPGHGLMLFVRFFR